MTTAPNILLLVNGAPNVPGVGNIFLRDIARYYPKGKMVRYSLVMDKMQEDNGLWCGHIPFLSYWAASSVYPLISSLCLWWFRYLGFQRHLERITRLIQEEHIDLVWVVLNSPNLIFLTQRLMDQVGIDFVFTIWDPPELFVINSRIDWMTFRALRLSYASILQQAKHISVICESMKRIFHNEYGVDSLTMLHGIRRNLWMDQSAQSEDNQDKEELTVGFAGSMYAKVEWKILTEALDSVGGKIAGKQVRIKVLGNVPKKQKIKPSFVEYLGYCPFESALKILSKMDVAYLPYWFQRKYSYVVKTSFPTKLSTYVAAGVPVLYHGPSESSPAAFLKEYPVGEGCYFLDTSEILRVLENLLIDRTVRQQCMEARWLALRNVFDHEIMLSRFFQFIGIERTGLI